MELTTNPTRRVVKIETVNKMAKKTSRKKSGGAQKISGEKYTINSIKDAHKAIAMTSAGRKFFLFRTGCILIYHMVEYHP